MNYSEILSLYHPLEKGDFMSRYLINGREYVIYSPEHGSISCVELEYFKEISPYQLAVLIQRNANDIEEEIEEFEFEYICSKDDLIKYLFGVTENKDGKVSRANKEGYLLYEVNLQHKVRNIYEFDSEKKYQLLFSNDVCYANKFENLHTGEINVCWNPLVFSFLEKDLRKNPSYLLASSNPIVCAYINKITETQKINMYVDENCIESLRFLSYYTIYKKLKKQFSIFEDDRNITISVIGWHPVTLVKFISKIQNLCNKMLKEYYNEEGESVFYQLKAVESTSFVVFPNNKTIIEVFLTNIISEINCDDISICYLPK